MQSIWLNLLWKEWREQRGKLMSLTAILFAVPAAILLVLLLTDDVRIIEGMVFFPILTLTPYIILAGMFVGMSVAGGENSRRTMRYSQSLPTPMWQFAFVKLLMAILVVSIPVVLLISVVWCFGSFVDPEQQILRNALRDLPHMSRPWGITNWYVASTVASILGVSSLLLWTAACGVNRSDEVRAGAVAFLVIATVWGCWVYAMDTADRYSLTSLEPMLKTLRVALPGGPGTPQFGGGNQAFESILAGTAHLALLFWFVGRFGRVAATRHAGQGLQVSDFFRFKSGLAPRRTSLGAIAWKQFRETAPLAIFAVVAVLAIVWLIYLADRNVRRPEELGQLLGGIGMSVGVLVALVAGVGVLLEDYKPGVNNFWRSRPVNMHVWFAVKYVTGLVVVAISFGSILLLANGLSGWQLGFFKEGVQIAMLFLGCYSLSLCCYALVRQPIYAVILAVVIPYIAATTYVVLLYHLGWEQTFRVDIASFLMGLGFVIVLAWQAVLRDWGWKQGR